MKNKKHSFEFKMAVVQSYLNNEGGYKALAKQYQINPSLITRWVNNYNEFGPDSLLKHMTKTTYTREFKQSVLDYRQENLLSYKDTAHHFGIRNPSMIANWHRRLRDGGHAALEEKRRGRVKNMSHQSKKTSQPLNETEREELERLREELKMSELENIILKKLKALPTKPTKKKR